jgi:Zn-dependent protease with chaperone function
LTGCQVGALVLGFANRTPEQAVLLQSLWMTLWGFFGLLVLPSFSRTSVFAADRAAAALGFDVKSWIRAFPSITGEDGNAKKLVQRVFYPIPSTEERLRGLAHETRLPILGNVARTNLFLSLATLTILGRCVHCNAGRPELWVFPPTD